MLLGAVIVILIVMEFEIRIPAGIYYFFVCTSLKSLGRTESSVIASIFTICVLKLSVFPAELVTFLFMFIFWLSQTKPRNHIKENFTMSIIIFVLLIIIYSVIPKFHYFIQDNFSHLVYWTIVIIAAIELRLISNYLIVSLVIRRKIFHLMLILIFIPGLQVKVF